VLAQLQKAHLELQAAIAALETETACSTPDQARLSAARLQVTRLSGRRKMLIDCTIGPHLRDIPADDARQIQNLRSEAARMAVESSEHIVGWTMANIVADWDGYRRASAEMRESMRRRIADEQAILYPLLQTRGG